MQAMRNPLDNLHSNWAYMVMSQPGLDAQGVVRPAAADAPGRYQAQTPRAEAAAGADGVQAVRQRLDPPAVPDRQDRPADRLPAAVVEPVGRTLLRLAEAMRLPMRC